MRREYSYTNRYTVLENGEPIGWIDFIKYADRDGWFIKDASCGGIVTPVHFNADRAKQILEENGLTWKPGKTKTQYLYY